MLCYKVNELISPKVFCIVKTSLSDVKYRNLESKKKLGQKVVKKTVCHIMPNTVFSLSASSTFVPFLDE